LHGLRHTAASIMLSRGVPLIVVSRQLGHTNPNITATVYAHLIDQDQQLHQAAAVFEAEHADRRRNLTSGAAQTAGEGESAPRGVPSSARTA
jgi:site-specific recombinase XerC